MLDEKLIRKDFPMLSGDIKMQNKPLVWLDNASTTFKPSCVLEAVSDYYTKSTSNSHRGDYDLCYDMDMKVLETRKTVAKLLNANVEEIAFTSGNIFIDLLLIVLSISILESENKKIKTTFTFNIDRDINYENTNEIGFIFAINSPVKSLSFINLIVTLSS